MKDVGGRLTLGLGLAFVVGPLLLVLVLGFNQSTSISVDGMSLGLTPFLKFANDESWVGPLRLSLALAACVSVAAVFVGSCAAWVNVRQNGSRRAFVAGLLILPSITPTVVYAVGLVLLQYRTGTPPLAALVVGHLIVATPFAFLTMRIGLNSLRPELAEAARLLGATRRVTFVHIVMPQLLPYCAVAGCLAASVSLAEPVLAIFLLNDSSATLPQRTFQGLRFSFDPLIMTAGAITVVTCALTLLASLALVRIYVRAR